MFGRFFRTAEVDELAEWIVTEVKRSLPAAYSPGTKNIANRAEQLNVSIGRRITEFTQTTKLNIYKTARLTARVREGMFALGYPETFVKSFSFDLISRLQAAGKQKKT